MLSRERQTPAGYPHPERERRHRNSHKNTLRREVGEISDSIFSDICDDPGKIRSGIAHTWVELEGKPGRASICTLWIGNWVEETVEPVAQADDCPVAEDLYNDFLIGLSFISGTIETGLREMDGVSDEAFKKAYESEGLDRSLLDYLREKEYAQKCAERLGKDRTGLTVVDKFYQDLVLGKWEEGFRDTDMSIVLKGANLARRIYKGIYPLSVGLGSSDIK